MYFTNFGRRHFLTLAAGSLVLKGQSKEFEVASIKPSAPAPMGEVRMNMQITPGGRLVAEGMSAKFLIQYAYDVRDFQVTGGPSWMGALQWDINAKAESASTPDQTRMQMQALLAERFKLQFHRETKEMSTYALVVAKGGSKLKVSEVDGSDKNKGGRMSMGRGQFGGNGLPVGSIARALGQVLDHSVIDQTGLEGNYDFELKWKPEQAPPEDPGPSVFTALQEQLGLKLESTKGQVEMLIVDRIEKPADN